MVYIETAAHFSWFELLPDPQSIEGFESHPGAIESELDFLASRLKGLGFHVIGTAGFGGSMDVPAGRCGASVEVLAFESSEQAERAIPVLFPPEPSEHSWKVNLVQGPLTMEGIPGEWKVIAYSKIKNSASEVWIVGDIVLKLNSVLLRIGISWKDVPGELGPLVSWVIWTYQDGYIVKVTDIIGFPPKRTEERVISVEEVAGKLQYLARLVATTVRNKLGSSDN